MWHWAPSVRNEIKMYTRGFACPCVYTYFDRVCECINTHLGQTHLCLPFQSLMRSTKSKPSEWSIPSLFLLINCLESWQQEAHNSFTVTFRCHLLEIIFILIYHKLSWALQECHFKVPSIQPPTSPPLTSSVNAQRSAYWYSSYLLLQPLHHLWKMTVSHTTSAVLPGSPANDIDSV